MTADHRVCDRLLADSEKAATGQNWSSVARSTADFGAAMERHFLREEEVIFPELEKASPQCQGPAHVMRLEHAQMRHQLADLAAAVQDRDPDRCLGILDTLHIFAQQHNAKEEAVLYPLADQYLSTNAPAIIERLEKC
jgi:iron-sulfur cluster repair protein YtfE (RIC family)